VRRLTPSDDPNLLVGADTGDDAAVWQLSDERALVFTADFITPVVDDARTWGRVAAANAASDVYAMGGRPLLALNLVCWNRDELSIALLDEVLAGGQDVAESCGFAVAGGHTVDDPEPKYGMAVVGEVDPRRMLTNKGLRDGDLLVLSKPLGLGIITTAIKFGRADEASAARAIATMVQTNDVASRVALKVGATGATDVSGFGLLGHGGKMAEQSGVDLEIWAESVPVIAGVRELAEAGAVPGGTERNRAWVEPRVTRVDVDDMTVTVLADAQTSGGLLFGVAPDQADAAVDSLRREGHDAAVVGVCRPGAGQMSIRARR
jgi:selenide,water dikinase